MLKEWDISYVRKKSGVLCGVQAVSAFGAGFSFAESLLSA